MVPPVAVFALEGGLFLPSSSRLRPEAKDIVHQLDARGIDYAIWSDGARSDTDALVSELVPLLGKDPRFVFSKDEATPARKGDGETVYFKDLRKVEGKCALVDPSPHQADFRPNRGRVCAALSSSPPFPPHLFVHLLSLQYLRGPAPSSFAVPS